MFNSRRKRISGTITLYRAVSMALEPLENRQLLSANSVYGFDGGLGSPISSIGEHFGHGGQTIAFSLAPTAVQTGLDKLATADGLTDPTSTLLVALGNSNGIETYSVTLDGTGTVSTLTVDPLGDAVNAPAQTTTTWATLDGAGTGSDTAAATEITAIATALSLTAPVSTDTVDISTTSAGAVTYSIRLSPSSSTTTTTDSSDVSFDHIIDSNITVDSAGNPVGDQKLPFSVMSTTVQAALNKNAPTGSAALASTSTQSVDVRSTDGITTYSTNFTTSGTQTTVTVDSSGTLTSLPTDTTTTFSALSSTVQTELQTLATADGVTTTIADTQSVDILNETNGTILYSVTLSATGTNFDASTYTFNVTVTSDSDGNPTTLPGGRFGFGGGGMAFGGPISGGTNTGDCGPGGTASNGSSGSNSSSGSNASSGTIISPPASNISSGTSTATLSTASLTSYPLVAKLLAGATSSLGMLSGYLVEFAPASTDTSIVTDVETIVAAQKQLVTDTKALTTAQKLILKTDTKALAAAVKSAGASETSLVMTLKTDANTWKAAMKTDAAAVRKAKGDSTALTAARAQLATDESAAASAIATDVAAIQSATESNTGVVAVQAKLAKSLPTIAADESAINTDVSQLVSDFES